MRRSEEARCDTGRSAHLPAVARVAGAAAVDPTGRVPVKPPELGWRDYLVMLLHIGAEIEHALMVEYLYAAYSLGGPQVPAERRREVRDWRESILTVAREEMGHLLTVQNLLCLVGGPPSFDREDYPWDSPYYPFPFRLEPLTLDSLACYVFAEMEPDLPGVIRGEGAEGRHFEEHDRPRIVKAVEERVRQAGWEKAHHVAEIYDTIRDILEHPDLVPDSCFDAASYARQASWDEWGKGFRPVADDDDKPILTRQPNVIVAQMGSRTEAIAGLKAIAGQGEAPHLRGPREKGPSHFDRFVEVYQAFEQVGDWQPVRAVPVNPTTRDRQDGGSGTYIESDSSRGWASLFNVRYRMLLAYLAHTYRLPRQDGLAGRPRRDAPARVRGDVQRQGDRRDARAPASRRPGRARARRPSVRDAVHDHAAGERRRLLAAAPRAARDVGGALRGPPAGGLGGGRRVPARARRPRPPGDRLARRADRRLPAALDGG